MTDANRLYGFGTIFKDDSGQSYFYPYGPLGKGYHLTPDREEEVLKTLRRGWLVLLSGASAASFFAAWALIDPLSSIFGPIGRPVVFLFVFAYLLWQAWEFERATSGLRRSSLSTMQVLRLSARNTPWAFLLIQVALLIAWLAVTQLPDLFPAKGANTISVILGCALWLAFASLVGHHIWAKTIDRLTHRDI